MTTSDGISASSPLCPGTLGCLTLLHCWDSFWEYTFTRSVYSWGSRLCESMAATSIMFLEIRQYKSITLDRVDSHDQDLRGRLLDDPTQSCLFLLFRQRAGIFPCKLIAGRLVDYLWVAALVDKRCPLIGLAVTLENNFLSFPSLNCLSSLSHSPDCCAPPGNWSSWLLSPILYADIPW